jgi:hypothetical protein
MIFCHDLRIFKRLSKCCRPLILKGDTSGKKFKGFRFESYWLKLPAFQDVMKQAWDKPLATADPIRRLHITLARTSKALKQWEKNSIGNIQLQLTIIKEVIWQLDQAQERRNRRDCFQGHAKGGLFGTTSLG